MNMNEIPNDEFTDEELAQFKPIEQVLPAPLLNSLVAHQAQMSGKRGKQKKPIKTMISIRLSADVVEKFRATGKGWQTRIDEILRQHIA